MPLRFHRDAFEGIPQQDMQRLMAKIEWLWTNRLAVNHFPLSGNLGGFYKRRLGNYRIIYTYEPNPDDMVIRLTGLRDDIYHRPV